MTLDDIQRNIDPALWLGRLEHVFIDMDKAYDRVAEAYGFQCRGCVDNCCYTRFYHHTLVEYLYLKKGLDELDPKRRAEITLSARDVVEKTTDADKQGLTPRIMCPLNHGGLCLIYTHRPMVCRLHGLEHELRKPGQNPVRSSGCDLFVEMTRTMDYIAFDRTPFYKEMAALEGAVRQATGFMGKMRHTIAEMVLL
jgi:Fe-S-cluster containining protein